MEQSERYKKSLLKAIEREWTALLGVVDRLSPEQMSAPDSGGWSPKDNLAHLSRWLDALLGYHIDGKTEEEVLGLPAELAQNFDFDRVNAFLFEKDKNRPIAEVLAELKTKAAEVVSRLEAMPLENLMKPRHPDDPQKQPLVLWVLGDSAEHYAEHRATIEKALNK
jgi:hypothetical protein